MNGFLLLTALLAPAQGAGVGEDLWMWKQNDQGIEYIVQIEPPVVTAMTTGKEVYSNVPEQMQVVNINRVRFRHGTGKFTEADVASTVGLLGVTYGYQPMVSGGIEFLVQIPPVGVREFQNGRDVIIDIPADVKKIQRFVIFVGNDTLPRSLTAPVNPGPVPPPIVSSAPPGPIIDPNAPPAPLQPPPYSPNLPNENPYTYPTGGAPLPARRASQDPLRPAPYLDPTRTANQGNTGQPSYGQQQPPPYLAANPNPPNYQPPPNYQAPNYQPNYQPGAGQPPRQAPYPYSTGAPAPAPNLNPAQPTAPPPTIPVAAPVTPPPVVSTQAPTVTTSPISTQRPNAPPGLEEQKKANILPNFLTVMALFASLGANLFLGWVAMQLYDRYRRALTDMRDQSRRVARA